MTIYLTAECPEPIMLGYAGDYGLDQVCIDFSKWQTEFGSGELYADYKKPDGTSERLSFVIDQAAAQAVWIPEEEDTREPGRAQMQLVYEVAEPVARKAKSCSFAVYIDRSL